MENQTITQPLLDVDGSNEEPIFQTAPQKLSKFQWAWYLMVYVNSPLHIDALSSQIDFTQTWVSFPPKLPPHFPTAALVYVYVILLAAIWNTLVWVAGTVIMSPLWYKGNCWGASTHHLSAWLLAWELMLILRGGFRKLTTSGCFKLKPGVKPPMPIGAAFDLCVWNCVQFTVAAKLLQLVDEDTNLDVLLDISPQRANTITWTLYIAAWTTVLDSMLRFVWPFMWSLMGEDFERTASSSFVYTLPECTKGEECSICLSSSCEKSEMCAVPCGHSFHRDCLVTWFESVNSMTSCPMCRRKILHLAEQNPAGV